MLAGDVPNDLIEAALSPPVAATEPPDPTDPNYWVYLMHDIEIVDPETETAPSGAALAFYGQKPRRRRR
jgi:hypothetical protein